MVNWSVNLFRIAGIGVRVHLLLPLLVLGLSLSDFAYVSAAAGLETLLFFLILFLSVLLHEFGHAFASFKAGGTPRIIVVWLLGGVTHVDDAPLRPGPQFLMALAGPAVNLFIAALMLIALVLAGSAPFFGTPRGSVPLALTILNFSFVANAALFLFNLVPALPMDGGAMLRWFLTYRIGFIHATRVAGFAGQAVAVLLGLSALVLRSHMPFMMFLILLGTAIMVFLECERQKRLADELESEGSEEWIEEEDEFETQEQAAPAKPSFFERIRAKRQARRREQEIRAEVDMRERVDELLEKIHRKGIDALSDKERNFLRDASKRFGNKTKLDGL